MSWRTVLIKDGEYLKLKLDNVVIFKEDYEYVIPLSDIAIIVLEGLQTTLTTRLLSALTKYNISLIICDHTHTPAGIYHAYNGHSRASKMLQKQLLWDDGVKGVIWSEIIKHKIKNQLEVLRLNGASPETIEKLRSYIQEVQHHDSTNREGHAAKVYFNALFGNEFSRQNDEFAINAALNYGYSVVRAQFARLTVAYGLVPMIGVFHKSEYNQFNLVDDLMEPFRPFVDSWVFQNMQSTQFLTFENRVALVDLLNKRAIYKKGNYTLGVIMEKYITDFIQFMETGDFAKLHNPILKSFEGAKSEV